jgi:HK97 family phage major capsid protein
MSSPFTQTTTTSAEAWRPDIFEFAAEDILPNALVMTCTTVGASVEGDAVAVRCAFVNDADDAEIVGEGNEIDESDPGLDEVLIYTSKVSQLVKLSNEQFMQPQTANSISASVARAVTYKADRFFASQPAPTPPAVAPVVGLFQRTDLLSIGHVATNLDTLIDGIAQLQKNLSIPSMLLLDPLGWAEFKKLKTGSDRNLSLLGAGTTDAQQLLLNLPVVVNPRVPDFAGAVIDRNAIMSAVGSVKVAVSEHAAFSQDATVVRCTFRSGHNVVRPDRIGLFSIGEGGS